MLAPLCAFAQGWRPFASVAPWTQGDADLEAGGDFRASSVILRAGVTGPIGKGHRGGLTFSYDFTDYEFSSPAGFAGSAPWNDLHRIGLSAPLLLRGEGGWAFIVTPSFDYFMEQGARSSEALGYGAVLAAAKRFDADRQIGFGLGIFDQLEEVKLFPFIVVDWKLGDRWRLANPLPAGPTGGAGLELDYRFDNGWTLGGGAAYRSARFRLSEDNVVANGIGETRSVAAFLHAGRELGSNARVGFYAGALLAGELRVESASGEQLARQDFDPAPFLGAALTLRY